MKKTEENSIESKPRLYSKARNSYAYWNGGAWEDKNTGAYFYTIEKANNNGYDFEANNFHKNKTSIYFQIADANHGMYHTDSFETEEEAREVIHKEYTTRSKNDGHDWYWRNRKQVVIKITRTQEVLE